MKNILILIFFSYSLLLGQTKKIDSLKAHLNSTEKSVEQALLYAKLAKLYEHTEIDSALHYAKSGYNLSEQKEYSIGIAENAAALGDFYVMKNQLDEAKVYYSIALEYFLEEDMLFDHTQISMILGNISLAQNRYIEALKLYQYCLDTSIENNFNSLTPHLYHNLGELYLDIQDYDDAQEYLDNAYKLFNELGDEYNAAHALSNISSIKSILGDDDKAIQGYLDVIRVFSVNENWEDIAVAYNAITEIYLKNQDFKKAEEYLTIALNTINNTSGTYSGPLSLPKSKIYTTASKLLYYNGKIKESTDYAYKALNLSYVNSYKKKIFENALILSKIYDQNKKLDSALAYTKIYIEYNEEYQNEYDLKRITQLKMQHEFDEILKKKQIDDLHRKADYKRKELIYIGVSILTILATIIMILLYRNQKTKTAKIMLLQKNLELEKAKLNQEIDYKKKELASNMMYLIEKNEFITSIARKLVELKPTAKKDNQNILQQIINELKLNSSSKIWDEFELRFKEVHSDFYDALSEAFPDLTPNEVKICAFLRLNMSTKEISSITHQSVKSINMARFRLRKKLNVEREENLIAFLTQL